MREIRELMEALYRYFPIPDEEQKKGAAHWVGFHHDTYRFKLWLSPGQPEYGFGLGAGYSSFEIISELKQMTKSNCVKPDYTPAGRVWESKPLRDWHDLTGGEQSLVLAELSSYPTAAELFNNKIWPGRWLYTCRGLAEDEIRQLIDEVAALEKKHG